MSWIAATLVSAAFLGLYDLCTKHAVRENAVLPVLFLSNLCGATVWLVLLGAQSLRPDLFPKSLLVPSLGVLQHAQLALKSLLVASSWICTYFALKNLPVSIVSPLRATGPVWTLLGALLVLQERPGALEIVGLAITVGSFVLLSLASGKEGVQFHRNIWVGWLMVGTILGAGSGLYDKYLLGRAGFAPATVQAWFFIYLSLFFLPLAAGWLWRLWPRHIFEWRWSVPLVSLSLLVSDFVYFAALHTPGSLVSIVASLRRSSILVAFFGGMLMFGERGGVMKFLAVAGMLGGMVFTMMNLSTR